MTEQRPGMDEIDLEAEREGSARKRSFKRAIVNGPSKAKSGMQRVETQQDIKPCDDILVKNNVIGGKISDSSTT